MKKTIVAIIVVAVAVAYLEQNRMVCDCGETMKPMENYPSIYYCPVHPNKMTDAS